MLVGREVRLLLRLRVVEVEALEILEELGV